MQRYESQLAFILRSGIKDKGFVHSLPADMITKQVKENKTAGNVIMKRSRQSLVWDHFKLKMTKFVVNTAKQTIDELIKYLAD